MSEEDNLIEKIEMNSGLNNSKVSLIVPMYYCEEYVDSLLDRLCGQDYKDIEIICVLDGSFDNTLDKVKEYSNKDNRIQVYEREHKGAGAARNFGMSKATGKYLMFLDADDVYELNYVSKMVYALEKTGADMAVCQYKTEDMKTGINNYFCGYKYIFYPANKAIATSSIKGLTRFISVVPHNKIMTRDFLIKNKIVFSETMSLNDAFFSTSAMLSLKSIVFVKDHLFTYRKFYNPKSISTTRGRNPKDVITVYRELYKWIEEKGIKEEYLNEYILKWNGSVRNYARFCKTNEFAESVAEAIAKDEPWKNVSNQELKKMSLLNCAVAKRDLKRYEKKLMKCHTEEEKKHIEKCIEFTESEIKNFEEIKRILKDKYGKDIDANESLLQIRFRQIYRAGLSSSFQVVSTMIINKFVK